MARPEVDSVDRSHFHLRVAESSRPRSREARVVNLDDVLGEAEGDSRASVRGFSASLVSPDDPQRAAKVGPWVHRLSWAMDNSIKVPLSQRRVGLDGVIGVLPGIGDAAGLVVSCLVVVAGVLGGVSGPTTVRMVRNVIVDAGIGAIPFAGDVFDFARKTNQRNVALIDADLIDRAGTAKASMKALIWTVLAVVGVLVAVSIAAVLLGWWVYRKLVG